MYSLPQRCTEHMFTLWRSLLAQSGVTDHEAVEKLIFALQTIPPLRHLADRCNGMCGKISLSISCIFECGAGFLAPMIVMLI